MKRNFEIFLALLLLMIFLTLAWALRIEDPFGEALEDEMLRDEAGLRP